MTHLLQSPIYYKAQVFVVEEMVAKILLSKINNQTISGSSHGDQHKMLTFALLSSLLKMKYSQIELQETTRATTL